MGQSGSEDKRPPRWLRVALLILLVIFVCVAFYLNNLKIIERLSE